LTQSAFSALQAGDASRAKNGFQQIIGTGQADTTHWLGMAFACARLGDNAGALAAVDKSLELGPRNLRAVLLKADLLTRQGESRPALQHYKYALKLAPGTRIPPHNVLMNTRLICHLPLIVPPDCGALRVGNEERPWVEGEMLIFDDSMEHEAWNNSDQERVILLFEIWRPEITRQEREILTTMLIAVKEYADLQD
jgi:tetratricopeptide (TPR) repeat protein